MRDLKLMSKNYKDRYQRKHSITLCFNDEEFAQVEELASMLKKPRATAVRDLILNKDFKLKKEISKNKTGDVYFELHKIGVNINQIARAINTDIDKFISYEFAEDFLNLFEEITNEIEEIKRRI
ncbi:plasmid mobilization relaxosome protein MobC [Klebsiella pneumoniae]|nr:plasmid mobilization relaxosome protein MobC [Klebsiella pneumoniae]